MTLGENISGKKKNGTSIVARVYKTIHGIETVERRTSKANPTRKRTAKKQLKKTRVVLSFYFYFSDLIFSRAG